MTPDEAIDLAVCAETICDPVHSKNPVAWHNLHKAGFTREMMQSAVAAGEWLGPKPCFENAPAYDSGMWLHLEGVKIQ